MSTDRPALEAILSEPILLEGLRLLLLCGHPFWLFEGKIAVGTLAVLVSAWLFYLHYKAAAFTRSRAAAA